MYDAKLLGLEVQIAEGFVTVNSILALTYSVLAILTGAAAEVSVTLASVNKVYYNVTAIQDIFKPFSPSYK